MTPTHCRGDTPAAADVDAAVAGIGLMPAFQPVVALSDRAVVGFEALSRWPSLNISDPHAVFTRATETGQLDQLDQLSIESAVTVALERPLPHRTVLFVNCEPATSYASLADSPVMARARDELQLVFEFTERDLLARPRSLLKKVAALQAAGFALALDDVGAQPDSLALLDVINPDVIKLDRKLVQSQTRYEHARVLAAVLAHHERTDALILAEGIETEEHLEQALAMGASLGQGYLFGPPGPLPGRDRGVIGWPLPGSERRANRSPGDTPFEIAAASLPIRSAGKATLLAFSRHIETQASYAPDRPMVLTALQRIENFVGATRRRYEGFASSLPLVGVFGQNLPEDLGPDLRCVSLDPEDPLSAQWVVLVLGAQAAFALIARECPGGDIRDRRFEFAITYERSVVSAAARSLLDRMN